MHFPILETPTLCKMVRIMCHRRVNCCMCYAYFSRLFLKRLDQNGVMAAVTLGKFGWVGATDTASLFCQVDWLVARLFLCINKNRGLLLDNDVVHRFTIYA